MRLVILISFVKSSLPQYCNSNIKTPSYQSGADKFILNCPSSLGLNTAVLVTWFILHIDKNLSNLVRRCSARQTTGHPIGKDDCVNNISWQPTVPSLWKNKPPYLKRCLCKQHILATHSYSLYGKTTSHPIGKDDCVNNTSWQPTLILS